MTSIRQLEQDMIAAAQAGDETRCAEIRQQIADAGLPQLAAELERIQTFEGDDMLAIPVSLPDREG